MQQAQDARLSIDGLLHHPRQQHHRRRHRRRHAHAGQADRGRNRGDRQPDDETAKKAIDELPGEGLEMNFNSLIRTQTSYHPTTKKAGTLNGDASVRSIQGQFCAACLPTRLRAWAAQRCLSDAGISFKTDGSMSVDSKKFAEALADPSKKIGELFAGNGTVNGFAKTLETRVKDMLGTDGLMIGAHRGHQPFDQVLRLPHRVTRSTAGQGPGALQRPVHRARRGDVEHEYHQRLPDPATRQPLSPRRQPSIPRRHDTMFGGFGNRSCLRQGRCGNRRHRRPAQADPDAFDGALLQVRTAGIAIGNKDIPAKGTAISKAVEIIINGLKVSLDLSAGGELAQRLAALYDYMSDRLLYANLHNSQPALDEVAGLLATLREAWAEIRSQVQPAVEQAIGGRPLSSVQAGVGTGLAQCRRPPPTGSEPWPRSCLSQ